MGLLSVCLGFSFVYSTNQVVDMAIKYTKYIALLVFVFLFGVFVGYANKTEHYESIMDEDTFEFIVLRSGNIDIDVEMIVSMSPEGILTYTLYNNTSHYLNYSTGRGAHLFKKTYDEFYQLHITYDGLILWSDVFFVIHPFNNVLLKQSVSFWYFNEGDVPPGIYKFVQTINVVSDFRNNDYSFLGTYMPYVIFEIR